MYLNARLSGGWYCWENGNAKVGLCARFSCLLSVPVTLWCHSLLAWRPGADSPGTRSGQRRMGGCRVTQKVCDPKGPSWPRLPREWRAATSARVPRARPQGALRSEPRTPRALGILPRARAKDPWEHGRLPRGPGDLGRGIGRPVALTLQVILYCPLVHLILPLRSPDENDLHFTRAAVELVDREVGKP